MTINKKLRIKLHDFGVRVAAAFIFNTSARRRFRKRLLWAKKKPKQTRVNEFETWRLISRFAEKNAFSKLSKIEFSSPRAARIGVFSILPDAEGPARIQQKACAKLMQVLDSVCRGNGLKYWFWYASLLGVYTRNGFVPWDDDIDICMLREDVEKLAEILGESSEYNLSVVYDQKVLCKQYRFHSRDERLPYFVDIGVWERACETTPETEARLQTLRATLENELKSMKKELPYWWTRHKLSVQDAIGAHQKEDISFSMQDKEKSREEMKKIEDVFEKYRQIAEREGIFSKSSISASVAYGFDNLTVGKRKMLYPAEKIFPLKEMLFEGFPVFVPADTEFFLDCCYADWPFVPRDSSNVHSHLNSKFLRNPDIVSATERFVDEPLNVFLGGGAAHINVPFP